MKKALVIIGLLLMVHISSAELTPGICEDWYVFGSINMTVYPESFDYTPGEMIRFTGSATNDNPYPITEGKVRAQVFYQEEPNIDYMLAEFFVAEDLYLGPGETAEFGGFWDVPANAKEGRYLIEVYYTIDEFNLGGVSFLRGLVGEMTSVDVTGGTDLVYMDVGNIMVNSEKTGLHQYQPIQEPETPITVTVPLVNEGSQTKANVKYMLYSWDDLREDFLYSKQVKMMTLGANSQTPLKFETSGLPSAAYLLKIVVETEKNDNILKLRLPVGGKNVKMNFLGVDKFPIKAGDEVKVFVCASNSADYQNITISDISLKIQDKDGRTIFSDSIVDENITPEILGYETSFRVVGDYDEITLSSVISDEAGNVESVDLVYKVETPACGTETMVCADGTLVIQVPPGCEFPACPAAPKPVVKVVREEPPRDNTLLLILLALIVLLVILLYYRRR